MFPRCDHGGYPIPAQPKRCVEPDPIVAAFVRGPFAAAVVVTYSSHAGRGNEHILADVFDAHLRKLFGSDVTPDRRGSDQFWPASAIDRATGALGTCFYDTTGDSIRRHAWYTCTVSRDEGRTWSPPVRAASAPSDETQTAASISDYGDYEGLAVIDETAYPIWTDTRRLDKESEEIYVSAISASRLP